MLPYRNYSITGSFEYLLRNRSLSFSRNVVSCRSLLIFTVFAATTSAWPNTKLAKDIGKISDNRHSQRLRDGNIAKRRGSIDIAQGTIGHYP
jgi:hypothetical protein